MFSYIWGMPAGRPPLYTAELGQMICDEIACSSKSLKKICEENKMFPNFSTVFGWLSHEDKPEFLHAYTRAKQAQADVIADEIIQIADDDAMDHIVVDPESGATMENKEFINRSRLRIDARKWIASKLKPKKYGDKIDLTSGGDKIDNVAPVINIYNSGPPLADKEDSIDSKDK